MYMLRPDSQPSPFQSWPAGFEVGWPALKQAGPIRNHCKVIACFETGQVDGFETGSMDGFETGRVDGFETGWVDGFETGWLDGFETCWWTPTR